ncbi:MAG: hypothetical protein IKW06_02180 [Clostridia bacterium]|nr:hypothetical protein [Clostridia bacterium]
MLQSITEFLRGCTALKNRHITMEILGTDDDAVAVKTVACNPILHRYADGDSLRQFTFSVMSRESGQDAGLSAAFYEALVQRLKEGLPVLAQGQTPQRFEIVNSAAPDEHDYSSTRYELVCRLIYYQKGA